MAKTVCFDFVAIYESSIGQSSQVYVSILCFCEKEGKSECETDSGGLMLVVFLAQHMKGGANPTPSLATLSFSDS